MSTYNQQEARRIWAEYLRSGRFKQGRGRLHRRLLEGEKLCCLGVACIAYQEVGPGDLSIDMRRRGLDDVLVSYDDNDCSLPYKVREWLGAETDNCAVDAAEEEVTLPLSDLNDSTLEQWDFERIAERIEDEPKGMFV